MATSTQHALASAAAVAAGLALWLAFPSHNLWWLAPVGVALLAGVTVRAGARRGFLLGLVAGVSFFVPVLSWSGIYVGATPWFALALLEALYIAVMSAVVGVVGPGLGTRWALLVTPVAWMAQEWARGSTPWGGFPWARLAFSQADSPLAETARWLGAPGVTFAVAVAGALVCGAVMRLSASRWQGLAILVLAPLWVVGIGVVIAVPIDGRAVSVGFVQGNVPRPGLDFNAERRAVLDNHVRGTMALAEVLSADASLVVWPENSSDIDPLRNPDAGEQIRLAQQAVGVPLLVGAVLAEPVDHSSNVSLLYRGDGAEPERYTKLHPVPFAEYIPYREFFRLLNSNADLAGNFVAGSTIGVFDIDARGGSYAVLPTICFEVAYDSLMRNSVLEPEPGTESLLVVQTNNATFGFTDESEQQFAISRIRAIEHGRAVVHVSTVGVSGLIAPDGTVSDKTGLFTAEYVAGSPVVRSEITPADRLGEWPNVVAASGLLLVFLESIRRQRSVRVRPVSGSASSPQEDPLV